MKRPLRTFLFLIGTSFFLSALPFHTSDFGFSRQPAPFFAKVEPGMTMEQVRQLAGAPQRIARQVLYHRYLEQWMYDRPIPARLQFDCPRGEKPQLVWKQVFPAEKDARGREPQAP
jgi:hypothetical protein